MNWLIAKIKSWCRGFFLSCHRCGSADLRHVLWIDRQTGLPSDSSSRYDTPVFRCRRCSCYTCEDYHIVEHKVDPDALCEEPTGRYSVVAFHVGDKDYGPIREGAVAKVTYDADHSDEENLSVQDAKSVLILTWHAAKWCGAHGPPQEWPRPEREEENDL